MRVFEGSWALPMDGPPIARGAVALEGSRIVALRDVDTLRASHPHAPRERVDGVLMPGLIDAWVQFEHARFGGRVPGGRGHIAWEAACLEHAAELDESADARIGDAVRVALAAGTVAVCEVSDRLAGVSALGRAGMRGLVVSRVPGLRRETAEVLRAMGEEHRAESPWPGGLDWLAGPHGLCSTHPEVVRALCRESAALPVARSAAERAFLHDGGGPFAAFITARGADPPDWSPPGLDPVAYARSLGALGPHALVAHLLDARPAELDMIAETGTRVVLCPREALHTDVRLPPLAELLARGVRPALGSGSPAASGDVDVLAEAVTLRARFPQIAARVLLQMATAWGADALGLAGLGRLAVGASPGLVAVLHGAEAPSDPEAYVLASRRARRRLDL